MVLDIMLNGLVSGSVFAVLSVGFSLIFGVARILNLSHTTFYMIGAYIVLIGTQMLGFPVLQSAILAIAIPGILGMIFYKLLFNRVKERETAVVILSIALALLFQEILLLIFGGTPLRIPPFFSGFVDVANTRVLYQHLTAIGTPGIALFAIWLLLSKTKLGKAIKAVAQDREIANLMGINVNRIYMITLGISVALAGVAGVIVAPIFMVSPLMWTEPLIIVLAAVVLGGLGSVRGSIIASFILGFSETAVVFLAPHGSFLRGAVSLSVMVIVLLLRPEGLFGIVFEEERL